MLRSYMVFETGTYVGVLFQNLCELAGVLESRETPVFSKRLKIVGHADGVLKLKGRRLLEIKTINSRGFTSLVGPKEAHKQQIHAYQKALNLTEAPAVLVYLEKDRHGIKEYSVPFDPEFYLQKVERRIAKHFRHEKEKTIPDREGTTISALPCSWCDFKTLCWNEPAKLRKFERSLK